MININGIQVDLAGNISNLSTKWAIFTVEFEYDNKAIICHTFNYSVHKGLIDLISKILSSKVEGLDLRQSFVNSKYITVEIKGIYENSPATLLSNKYELIRSNKTYYPYGYNFLTLAAAQEKPYARALYNELIEGIDKNAMHCINKRIKQKGKTPKPVYQYEKQTGFFIKEYASTQEASENTGICISNINMCCNGHIKATGEYIWSYEKLSNINTYIN